jgi:glutamate synthase (NADPH/NADH) large chain
MFLAAGHRQVSISTCRRAVQLAFAIYHQRYSTNTFPQWALAQPFRMIAHNGEINTLRGNKNWMKSHEIRMVSEAFGEPCRRRQAGDPDGSSDSGALDAVWEILCKSGRTAPMAKAMLIPEAWSKRASIMPLAHACAVRLLQLGHGAVGWAGRDRCL